MSRAESVNSGPSPADVRYRARCPDCGWSQTHSERSRARAHQRRGCPKCNRGVGVSPVRVATDGGEIEPEDDRVDPENLPDAYTPAYVDVRGQGPVYVAHYTILESGWISVTEWTGRRAKLPPSRVLALREVRTERYGEPDMAGMRSKRVLDEDKREQARADYPGTVDGAEMHDDVNRGRGIETDGGLKDVVTGEFPVVSGQISDPDGATAYQALAIRVQPDDHPRLERAGFHTPQTQFVLFSPGGRPASDYDPYKLAQKVPGQDTGWVVEQLQELNNTLCSEIEA